LNAIVRKVGVSRGVVVCAWQEVFDLTGNRIKLADAVTKILRLLIFDLLHQVAFTAGDRDQAPPQPQ
jgi:hypothetical protein